MKKNLSVCKQELYARLYGLSIEELQYMMELVDNIIYTKFLNEIINKEEAKSHE